MLSDEILWNIKKFDVNTTRALSRFKGLHVFVKIEANLRDREQVKAFRRKITKFRSANHLRLKWFTVISLREETRRSKWDDTSF